MSEMAGGPHRARQRGPLRVRSRWIGRWRATTGSYKALWILLFLLFVISAIRIWHEAAQGQTAFLRWRADTQMLDEGKMIYRAGENEGYPNLPMMALILMPFHALGAMAGSEAWMALKFAIVIGIFLGTCSLVQTQGPPWPGWALLLLLLLNARIFVSDITHGNVNLIVGGLIVLALWATVTERPWLAGLAIGLDVVLKATPLLFLPYFLYKRQWKSAAGVGLGVILFGFLVPGILLGFSYTMRLTLGWYQQMVVAVLEGRSLERWQTSHVNQSLTGLVHRFFTDAVAIPKDPARGVYESVQVNLLSLDPALAGWLVLGASVLIMSLIVWLARTPNLRRHPFATTAEFALVFLAMLFISPRSWKHHYVLIILAHAVLLYFWLHWARDRHDRQIAGVTLWIALVLHSFTSEVWLGEYGADLTEALGGYVFGGFALFTGCGYVLYRLRREGWPPPSEWMPRSSRDPRPLGGSRRVT